MSCIKGNCAYYGINYVAIHETSILDNLAKSKDDTGDDNLIIANKPSVSELGNSDSEPIIIEYKGKSKATYDTKRDTMASTDSSWGSSSDCSTISEDNCNLNQSTNNDTTDEPKVRFSPADVATGKSVSNLTKPSSTKSGNSSNNKAVSLPVLESESDVPSSSQASKDFKSDPERIMITDKEKVEEDTSVLKPENDIDIVDPNMSDSVANRGPISRQGAVRLSSTRSRSGLRVRRARTNSGSPAASLLNQENDPGSEIKHLAMTYEDTSAGAVHCFQDERGQWFTYTFGDDSNQPNPQPSPLVELIQNLPSTSGQR